MNMESRGKIVDGPEATLNELLQQVYIRGANDAELPNILQIVDTFRKGVISGPDAIKKVHAILDFKQDDH